MAEAGPDVVGVGVVEFDEGVQRLSPGRRGGGTPCDVVGVAEVGQCDGFLVSVAEIAEQAEGLTNLVIRASTAAPRPVAMQQP